MDAHASDSRKWNPWLNLARSPFSSSDGPRCHQPPSDQIEALRLEETAGTFERARTIRFLAGIALKVIEAGNIATRLEALEAVLKAREVA